MGLRGYLSNSSTLNELRQAFGGLIDRSKPKGAEPVTAVAYDLATDELTALTDLISPSSENYIVGLAVGVGEPCSIEIWNIKKIFGGLEISLHSDGSIKSIGEEVLNCNIRPYEENQIPERIKDIDRLVSLANEVSLDHAPGQCAYQTLTQILTVDGRIIEKATYDKSQEENPLVRAQKFKGRMAKFKEETENTIRGMEPGHKIFVGLHYNGRKYGIEIEKVDSVYNINKVVGQK